MKFETWVFYKLMIVAFWSCNNIKQFQWYWSALAFYLLVVSIIASCVIYLELIFSVYSCKLM